VTRNATVRRRAPQSMRRHRERTVARRANGTPRSPCRLLAHVTLLVSRSPGLFDLIGRA
jgi:hypothetical protein